jgi:hypothetical protein
LCYTHIMDANHHIWRVWANKLHIWGVDELAATFLEALGPLTTLGAQFIYLGQPFLGRAGLQGHLEALAQMLENSTETRAFVDYLREKSYP